MLWSVLTQSHEGGGFSCSLADMNFGAFNNAPSGHTLCCPPHAKRAVGAEGSLGACAAGKQRELILMRHLHILRRGSWHRHGLSGPQRQGECYMLAACSILHACTKCHEAEAAMSQNNSVCPQVHHSKLFAFMRDAGGNNSCSRCCHISRVHCQLRSK